MIVGTAITRPHDVTARFARAVNVRAPLANSISRASTWGEPTRSSESSPGLANSSRKASSRRPRTRAARRCSLACGPPRAGSAKPHRSVASRLPRSALLPPGGWIRPRAGSSTPPKICRAGPGPKSPRSFPARAVCRWRWRTTPMRWPCRTLVRRRPRHRGFRLHHPGDGCRRRLLCRRPPESRIALLRQRAGSHSGGSRRSAMHLRAERVSGGLREFRRAHALRRAPFRLARARDRRGQFRRPGGAQGGSYPGSVSGPRLRGHAPPARSGGRDPVRRPGAKQPRADRRSDRGTGPHHDRLGAPQTGRADLALEYYGGVFGAAAVALERFG